MLRKNKKLKIPGIGARIVKSALAVALCMIVNLIRGNEGMVFYSQLAALWCIQMYRDKTLNNAILRTIGTIIGAMYGLIFILSFPIVTTYIKPSVWLYAIFVFISIIAVIYTTVIINKKQAAYFSCVVFLSIVINHIEDSNPYIFVWNRFLDTMIGICIGIFINNIRICLHPDRNIICIGSR